MEVIGPGAIGLGWRPEIAQIMSDLPGLGFTEVVAENVVHLPSPALQRLRRLPVPVVAHGVGLSLGSADPAGLGDPGLLERAADLVRAPLISEHLAFVRGGGVEAGHLLPLPRTRAAVDVLIENLHRVLAGISRPFAVEMVAATAVWPEDEFTDGQFVTQILDRVDVGLVLDLANVHANAVNQGLDAAAELATYPLERIAYCHIAGGQLGRDGRYRDTHTGPVQPEVLSLAAELESQAPGAPILLECDADYPPGGGLARELARIAQAVGRD